MSGPAKRRGSVRELHRELTRERLAEGAVECFAAKGYVATTIDDITATAGTTRATFYLHFKSKAEVALEVLRRLGEQFDPIYAELFELAPAPRRDKIQTWLGHTIDIWESTHAAFAALGEAGAVEAAVREQQQASFDQDIELLTAALEKNAKWTHLQARARATVLFSQLQQLFLRWSTHGWDVDRPELLEVLTDMWCAALKVRSSRS
ncbi:TetR/AcrR family transcriptional regulator [Nocardia sp. CA2R105]|uniref:TetR/AcrR family transcriptional regulator n=1 Tax=Nocardia coffeae TaxID=2873381 RepID=UPI001CA6F240|nr:TetR/AcrR family transcriptional regulator [Nocardia coffeae]MBY8856853.1 TetR/AcrR family transcriptional regulator [Nocardia coffeae]